MTMIKHALFQEDFIDEISSVIDRFMDRVLVVAVTALVLRFTYGILYELPRFEQFGR